MGTVIKNRGTSCVGVRKTGTTLIHVSTVMGTLYFESSYMLEGYINEVAREAESTEDFSLTEAMREAGTRCLKDCLHDNLYTFLGNYIELMLYSKRMSAEFIATFPKWELLGYVPEETTLEEVRSARLFHFSKSFLHHEMDCGAKKAGVKRIRIHDLRHSACAALIELGFSPVQIAERLGHESATITMRYAHLYPSVQVDMAEKLDAMFQEYEMEDDEEEDID